MATRGSRKRFSAADLARVLCAVDERIMTQALLLRQETCPTTLELIEQYLRLVEFLLGLLPAGAVAAAAIRLLVRLVRLARQVIERLRS